MPDNIRDADRPAPVRGFGLAEAARQGPRLSADRECHRKQTASDGKGEKAG